MSSQASGSEIPIHAFVMQTLSCSEETALSICQRALDRRYAAQVVIVQQGDSPALTFLLISGRVHARVYGSEGQMVIVEEFLSGDFFGAIIEAKPEPSAAELVAVNAIRVASFAIGDFLTLIDRYSCIGLAVSRMLLKHLRLTALKMTEQTTLSAAGRVHAELLRLARSGDGRTIRPAPVLSTLALQINSTRETVSRAINSLERRGIIRRERDALHIVAHHRLEELVI